jgi:hypothetical protein
MALFTDGSISSLEDLTAHDTSLLDIASVEGIDVTAKAALAQAELGIELSGLLLDRRCWDPVAQASRMPDLSHVVVTAPLKLWHVYRTLTAVYRDAYNNQLNDRYKGRRDEYAELGSRTNEQLRQIGVGLVTDPVPQAAQPALASATGSLTEGTYFATLGWLNSAGEEGASAVPVTITVAEATGFTVTPPAAPPKATGWNVYVGAAADSLTQQNLDRLAVGQSWVQSAALSTQGRKAGNGQAPNALLPFPRILWRG